MKIVNRKTFLSLPAGTVYQKYEPCWFGDLAIKGETVSGVDWYAWQIGPWFESMNDSGEHFETIQQAEATGEETGPMDFEIEGRDGLFDYDQLFAVWSEADVKGLANRLLSALGSIDQ